MCYTTCYQPSCQTEPASSREKSEPHDTQKPIHQAGPSGVRPCPCMQSCTGHRQRRSIASPHHAPRRPHQTSQPGRGGTRRAPPRRSGKARTRAGGFFGRATACALTYSPSARREERPSPSSPHRTARRFTSPAPAWRGGRNHGHGPSPSSPHDGSEKRRAGPDGRRVRVRARAGVSSATDDGHEHSAPRPTRLIQRAHASNRSCMEMEAQGFTSNPTDLCLCPSQSACLSVRSIHPFLSTGDRSIIGRGQHGRSPVPIEAPNVSF